MEKRPHPKEKIRIEEAETMTLQEFKRNIDALEYIINEKVIPLIANILKAIVTLICLSIKGIALILNYTYKITGGESVDAAKEFANNIKENPVLQDGIKSVGISIFCLLTDP